MAINGYSPCPAGTGKKIKFCCSDIVSDIEKIDRMLDGEQFIATIQHIDKLEEKGIYRACLMAFKSELLRVTDQLDAARAYAADFLRRFPENAVAWCESALIAALDEGGQAALEKLHRALALCDGVLNSRIYSTVEMVANELLEDGRAVPGRALLHLLNSANSDDRNILNRIVHFNRAADVPLLLKSDSGMMPCPAGVPWEDKFIAAVNSQGKGKWQEAADRLAALAAEVPDAPVIWHNLGVLRSWLGDDAGAAEALRRYAALPLSLEDAVEAEATAMFLSPSPLGDAVDALRLAWPVRDAERLQELLLSDHRVMPTPLDLASWPVSETPPPRMVAGLLDRQSLREGEPLSRENVPCMIGQMLLFGRQTDRPARLEIMSVLRSDADRVKSLLREVGGDTLEAEPEENVMGKTSASREMFGRRWILPPNPPREQVESLLKDDFRDTILNRWPDSPLGVLNGRSLRQAAGDTAAQVKCLAAILVVEQWLDRAPESFDFNELRSQLGLPTLGSIDPRQCDVKTLPLVRLERVDVPSLDDMGLVFGFHRATVFHAVEAARKFALAVIARPALASQPERVEAYRVIVETAPSLEEGMKVLDDARREAIAAGQSCAIWDLMELSSRFVQGDPSESMRLMQHIESRHIKEPGVAQALTRMLINVGLLNPDGTPVAMPGGQPGGPDAVPAEDSSKLWTPGGESAGTGGKLWTPGS